MIRRRAFVAVLVLILAVGGIRWIFSDPRWDAVGCMCLSPDGDMLALGTKNGVVRVLDTRNGNLVWSHQKHQGSVSAIAYSPDGGCLASVGRDGIGILWEASTGVPRKTLRHWEALTNAVFSCQGERLIIGSPNTLTACNPATGEAVSLEREGMESIRQILAMPERSDFIALRFTNNLEFWQDKRLTKIIPLEGLASESHVICGALSPDGRLLLLGDDHGTISLWDTSVWQRRIEFAIDGGSIKSVRFLPDGKNIVAVTDRGVIALYDTTAKTRVDLFSHPAAYVGPIVVSPKGNAIIAWIHWPRLIGNDILLWEIPSRKQRSLYKYRL
jgi:WD40 repeat protein